MIETKVIECDFCVVGGGLSGLAAAIAAAREGAKVVLMHERPMLGGNASSEIRMWISGAQGKENRETGIVEELELENLYRNPTKNYHLWDTVLYDFARREENLTLLLNCTCMDAKVEKGEFAHGRTVRIQSVTGYQMTTQRFFEVKAKLFSDCSGDSILAPLTGAEFKIGREAADTYGELSATTVPDDMTMGMNCMIQGRETHQKIPFTPPQFSKKLTDKDFDNREIMLDKDHENFWYLELGGNRDTIGETEEIRDELLGLSLGTWDYIKNSGKFNADNWELEFLGFLPGKRESRRMCGEHMLTQREVSDGTVFEDEVAFGGWPLDDHYPGGFYHRGEPNAHINTPSPYSLPYRSLYSKNVDNLFFAGRNISATHMGMSSTRVMATCCLLGEAVGKAAAIAARKNYAPHDVYCNDLAELQQMLMNEGCFLPNHVREISEACKKAVLSANTDVLRNGQDRAHEAIYHTNSETAAYAAAAGEEISYTFPETKVSYVHLVFDSDLERTTLPGSWVEQKRSMRANIHLDSPIMHMPLTLCKAFKLWGERAGEKQLLLEVEENRKRSYHVAVDGSFDKLVLQPISSWGDGAKIPVISFDFG